jgi:hypothetical protein
MLTSINKLLQSLGLAASQFTAGIHRATMNKSAKTMVQENKSRKANIDAFGFVDRTKPSQGVSRNPWYLKKKIGNK